MSENELKKKQCSFSNDCRFSTLVNTMISSVILTCMHGRQMFILFLQDGDGSIPARPHEIYEEFFGTSKNKAKKDIRSSVQSLARPGRHSHSIN